MRTRLLSTLSLSALVLATSCVNTVTDEAAALIEAGDELSAITVGDAEAAAVLALANDVRLTVDDYDDRVRLDVRAARNLVAHRDGLDALPGTDDDAAFTSLEDLDRVSWIGARAIEKMVAFALAHGYPHAEAPSAPAVADEDRAVLACVNDIAVTETVLDDDIALDARAARNIVAHRVGADGVEPSDDDDLFDSLAELDDVSYVGPAALDAIRAWALDHGYLEKVQGGSVEVIFSPQPYYASHNARVQQIIESATATLDIAMYSFSDYALYDAIAAALTRGVEVRIVFETASEDRKEDDADDRASTRSGRLEQMGANVRWVNKIMHHKFVIADGPLHDADAATTATIATGSGNWSYGAATRYDENTLFFAGAPAVALLLQREFDHMWDHSRDFVHDDTLPYVHNTLTITDAMIASAGGGESNVYAYFTSDNFNISEGSTTFRKTGRNTVSDQLVEAIEGATESVWVASGHLRSRPVSEALIAKRQSDPDVDIRVLLDGQEYISSWYQGEQLRELDDCLAEATTDTQVRNCEDRGFLFGYEVGEVAGIPTRYKYYAYRWHYTYAVQMHHKLMIVDGDELWTGSYNLSNNAEHNTFENMFVLAGPRYQEVIDQYEENFLHLWNLERDGAAYENLWHDVGHDDVVPLVFQPMTLEWDEITALKDHIRDNCAQLHSEDFRRHPEDHTVCPR